MEDVTQKQLLTQSIRLEKGKERISPKLLKIQKEVKALSKDGTNEFHKYNYLMEAQVTSLMKELLDKNGVIFQYGSRITDMKPAGKQILVNVEVEYRFIDAESGEWLGGVAAGSGADTGDKGVYKAITGAIKYIYMKTFNIPTGDDPENDKQSNKVSAEDIALGIID
jgi:hypothetical protein